MFCFDLEAIAVDVEDAHALTDCGRSAACRPDTVADANSASVCIHGLYNHHYLAKQSRDTIVEKRVGAVLILVAVGASTSDADDRHRENCKDRELQRKPDRKQEREQSGGDARRADEHEEKAWRDQLGNQQHDTTDQPKPSRIERKARHSAALGTLGTAFALCACAPPLVW